MKHHELTLPSDGHTSTWAGQTQSGRSEQSITPLSNRRIQLHFRAQCCSDLTMHIVEEHFINLGTYLYEFPMRHLGLQIDDVNNYNPKFLASCLTSTKDYHPKSIRSNNLILPMADLNPTTSYQLDLTHSPTIGREFLFACPSIADYLLSKRLQAVSFTYKYYPNSNALVILITLDSPHEQLLKDKNNNYPDFEFDQPLLFRKKFNMNGQITLKRKEMIYFHLHFHVQAFYI